MPNPSSTPRILLVDDNEAGRYAVSKYLVRAGYHVIEAANGQDALRHLAQQPDLIILDVRLPDMNGLEISRTLRSDPATRSIPILQISATFTRSSDKVKGLDAGADAYLAGAIEPDEMLAHVRMLLRLKSAQDALTKTNDRLRSVLSTIVDVFFGTDFEGRFLELNPAAERVFGRPGEQLAGKFLWTEFPNVAHSPFGRHFHECLQSQAPVHFEIESFLSAGTWWEGHAYPREDRIDVYLRDITERKVAERKLNEAAETMRAHVAELQAAQAELGRARDQLRFQNEALEARVQERTAKLADTVNDLETFSYSITHDMRAPLRAMQGFAKLLIESYSKILDTDAQDYLNRIASAANRLDLLIRDVLRYSGIVRADLQLVSVDTEQLLRNIIAEYPEFQPPHAEIAIVSPLPPVLGSEAFLAQCFSNILGNAVKFVAAGVSPRIVVNCQPINGFVRISFKDNGIGIPLEHQHRIFELFHRAQTGYAGTGIGLAIVRRAVERMGGRIGLESAPGQGSTFWLELRKAQETQ